MYLHNFKLESNVERQFIMIPELSLMKITVRTKRSLRADKIIGIEKLIREIEVQTLTHLNCRQPRMNCHCWSCLGVVDFS